jgi:hypothetical protein
MVGDTLKPVPGNGLSDPAEVAWDPQAGCWGRLLGPAGGCPAVSRGRGYPRVGVSVWVSPCGYPRVGVSVWVCPCGCVLRGLDAR